MRENSLSAANSAAGSLTPPHLRMPSEQIIALRPQRPLPLILPTVAPELHLGREAPSFLNPIFNNANFLKSPVQRVVLTPPTLPRELSWGPLFSASPKIIAADLCATKQQGQLAPRLAGQESKSEEQKVPGLAASLAASEAFGQGLKDLAVLPPGGKTQETTETLESGVGALRELLGVSPKILLGQTFKRELLKFAWHQEAVADLLACFQEVEEFLKVLGLAEFVEESRERQEDLLPELKRLALRPPLSKALDTNLCSWDLYKQRIFLNFVQKITFLIFKTERLQVRRKISCGLVCCGWSRCDFFWGFQSLRATSEVLAEVLHILEEFCREVFGQEFYALHKSKWSLWQSYISLPEIDSELIHSLKHDGDTQIDLLSPVALVEPEGPPASSAVRNLESVDTLVVTPSLLGNISEVTPEVLSSEVVAEMRVEVESGVKGEERSPKDATELMLKSVNSGAEDLLGISSLSDSAKEVSSLAISTQLTAGLRQLTALLAEEVGEREKIKQFLQDYAVSFEGFIKGGLLTSEELSALKGDLELLLAKVGDGHEGIPWLGEEVDRLLVILRQALKNNS